MRYAIITLELPLDGGELEDAQSLAQLIQAVVFEYTPLSGGIADVYLEDRAEGAMGRTRAEAMLRELGAG